MAAMLGLGIMRTAFMAAEDDEKRQSMAEVARVLYDAIDKDRKPRDIVTMKSLWNATAILMATQGSTNGILHLPAIAHEMGLEWGPEDFEQVRAKVPVLCDMKPSGKYMAVHLQQAGGLEQVARILLDHDCLYGDCMTITGQTIAEQLAHVPSEPRADQDVIRPWSNPVYPTGHLKFLRGNLAPDWCIAKTAGIKDRKFTGPARVFDSEDECNAAIRAQKVTKGDVVVIRYEGPVAGPGMPEMLGPTSELIGQGLLDSVALFTDSRFSGGSWGWIVAHASPEAALGGPIALVKDGDLITLDADSGTVHLHVSDEELERRRSEWKAPKPRYTDGFLALYAKHVSSPTKGCVLT
jgi:dihydroxy-acid dehydratase